MPRSGVYPQQLRDQAVRMVAEARSAHASEWAAITAVAKELGIGAPGTLRRWIRNAESGAATTTSAFEVVEVVEVVDSVTAPAVGETEPSPESDAPVSAPVYAPPPVPQSYAPVSAEPYPSFDPAPTYEPVSTYEPASAYEPAARYEPVSTYDAGPEPTYEPAPAYRPVPTYEPVSTYEAPSYVPPAAYEPPPAYVPPTYEPAPTIRATASVPMPRDYPPPVPAPLNLPTVPEMDGLPPAPTSPGHPPLHVDRAPTPPPYGAPPPRGRDLPTPARSRWESRPGSDASLRPYAEPEYRSPHVDHARPWTEAAPWPSESGHDRGHGNGGPGAYIPRPRSGEPTPRHQPEPGETSEQYRRLQREVEELKQVNEKLKDASDFFATQRGPSWRRDND